MPAKVSHSPFSTKLLVTKLTAPAPLAKIVKRSKLIDLLLTGMKRKLTLISAPAGYGKTTLLCEWMITANAIGWPVAWVSLDKEDDGLLRFWSYFIGALKTINPNLHQDLPGFLGPAGHKPDVSQLTTLINQIAEFPRQFSLILDDFHEIESNSIHQTLAYLIDHMPDQMHLVIASRKIPCLPISRLNVSNQFVAITASDLAFTLSETKTLMEEVMGVATDAEDIQTLNQLTEGWVAGLQLAGLSLRSGRDMKGFLANFAGSSSNILDYLTEEVLYQQDEPTRVFLIRSSIFDEFSSPLCDFVLGIQNSQDVIERLEQSNIMIVPLDDHRRWYRYHRLFVDALRIYLRKLYLAQVPDMHRLACEWLEKQGYPELAIPHALAAGEHEKAADIVEACALFEISASKMITVMHWIDRLPLDVCRKRPRLGIYYSLANIPIGHVGEAERRLNEVEETIGGYVESITEQASLKRQALMLRAVITCLKGDYQLGIERCDAIFRNMKDEHYFIGGLIKFYSHYGYLALDRLQEAFEVMEYAVQNLKMKQDSHQDAYLGSLLNLARLYKHSGKLHVAVRIYSDALSYALSNNLDLSVIRIAECCLADIYYEWNQLDSADELIKRAKDYYTRYGSCYLEWFYSPDILLQLAKSCYSQKDFSGTEKFLHSFTTKNIELFPIPFVFEAITSLQVRAWSASGNHRAVEGWKIGIQNHLDTNPQGVTKSEIASLIRVLQGEGKIPENIWLLDQLNLNTSPSGPVDLQIERFVIQALAWYSMNEKEKAQEMLLKALKLGEVGGYVRIFIDEGPLLRSMLSDLLDQEQVIDSKIGLSLPSLGYINTLLSNFETHHDNKPKQPAAPDVYSPMIEPLSKKELEILRLMTRGRSPHEIAQDLVVSIFTIKTHLKHIYRKLDVHNREEAIQKAIAFYII